MNLYFMHQLPPSPLKRLASRSALLMLITMGAPISATYAAQVTAETKASTTHPSAASTAPQLIDGVVAIVNDTAILNSQLERATTQAAAQLKAQNRPLPPAQQLYALALDQLITQQIQLDLIKKYGVSPDENEVNAALANLAKQNGINNLAQFQQTLDGQRAGSYQALRQKIIEDLAMQTLQQQQLTRRIKISEQDVDAFLKSPESNALEQSQYRTLHIRVPFNTRATLSDKSKKSAQTIAQKIAQALAVENPDINQIIRDAQAQYDKQLKDAGQIQGGDMGYHAATALPTDISKAIIGLNVGQVSEVILTPEGYNVVKLVDKRGGKQHIIDQWHTRHILISPSAALSPELAKQQIDSIYEQLRQGADFATLASTYSKDPGSASQGGDLGWVNEGDMVPSFEAMMKKTSVNDFSAPFQSQFGWHILKVDEKRQKDVTDNYRRNMARELLYQRLAPQAMEDWLQELRAQSFIQIMDKTQ